MTQNDNALTAEDMADTVTAQKAFMILHDPHGLPGNEMIWWPNLIPKETDTGSPLLPKVYTSLC